MLAAAVELADSRGYGALTMEALARSAGVSKQTIYRWWPSKAAVVLEALNEAAAIGAPPPASGSVAGDVRLLLRRTAGAATERNTRILAGLMAEAQLDPEFAASFRDGFLARRRAVLVEILRRGQARGEIAAGADPAFLAEVAYGAVWYRILSHSAPLDRRFADRLADAVLTLGAA